MHASSSTRWLKASQRQLAIEIALAAIVGGERIVVVVDARCALGVVIDRHRLAGRGRGDQPGFAPMWRARAGSTSACGRSSTAWSSTSTDAHERRHGCARSRVTQPVDQIGPRIEPARARTAARTARASARRRARRCRSDRRGGQARAQIGQPDRPFGRRRVGDDQQRRAARLRAVPGVEDRRLRSARSASSIDRAAALRARRSARAGCGPICAGRSAPPPSPARRPNVRAAWTARGIRVADQKLVVARVRRPVERQRDLAHPPVASSAGGGLAARAGAADAQRAAPLLHVPAARFQRGAQRRRIAVIG